MVLVLLKVPCFSLGMMTEATFFWGDAVGCSQRPYDTFRCLLVMHRNSVKASIFGGWTLHTYCKCMQMYYDCGFVDDAWNQ